MATAKSAGNPSTGRRIAPAADDMSDRRWRCAHRSATANWCASAERDALISTLVPCVVGMMLRLPRQRGENQRPISCDDRRDQHSELRHREARATLRASACNSAAYSATSGEPVDAGRLLARARVVRRSGDGDLRRLGTSRGFVRGATDLPGDQRETSCGGFDCSPGWCIAVALGVGAMAFAGFGGGAQRGAYGERAVPLSALQRNLDGIVDLCDRPARAAVGRHRRRWRWTPGYAALRLVARRLHVVGREHAERGVLDEHVGRRGRSSRHLSSPEAAAVLTGGVEAVDFGLGGTVDFDGALLRPTGSR